MFWRITGLSTTSPVDVILDKEGFTLEELLDEDEIIQECKAHNTRLINFLREKNQVVQLLQYIIQEAPEDAEKKRTFKFPFLACEIFTCEVDTILEALVEDEELMSLLFSFLLPSNSHSTLLAGYFSKVVVCLMLRKTAHFVNFVRAHPDIFVQLVDLIGITSIMEVLIRLVGADEHVYSKCTDSMKWLDDISNVLEMIVDKFSLSDSPEVHANAAETLCAATHYAPPGLAAKISSPSFVERLLHHALEDSRPKSVLFHALTVCISLLDPKRLPGQSSYYMFPIQLTQGPPIAANPKSIDSILQRLGDLLKILETSPAESSLPTTYGSLQPPLGKLRLKIVEFISVLLRIDNEAVEAELIRLGAIQQIINLFFEYPYNNFLHHHIEKIIGHCLDSKRPILVEHLLVDCNIIGKILETEKNFSLSCNSHKSTVPVTGRLPPRVGNIGHITRISNRLIRLGMTNDLIQKHLQENSEWVDWYENLLQNRFLMENVNLWDCGRPNAFHSDDEDFKIRDYDLASMANNLTLQYNNYNGDDDDQAHDSLEQEDEDVYFDGESAEVVISALRLGENQESSVFTNANWFAFEDNQVVNECSTSLFSSSSDSDETDEVVIVDEDEVTSARCPDVPEVGTSSGKPQNAIFENDIFQEYAEASCNLDTISENGKHPEWAIWDEASDSSTTPNVGSDTILPNGNLEVQTIPVEEAASNSGSTGDADAEKDEHELSKSPGLNPIISPTSNGDLERLGMRDTSITAISS